MKTIKNTALIVGANGVISTNLIEHLSSLGNWDIIGLSRRGGTDHDQIRYIAVDLLDLTDTVNKLSALTTVTHIFYAAYQDKDSWAALVEPNLRMLVNVITAIEPVAKSLQHVSLMQGYKVYGAHLGPFKTPAKESDAGHMPPEFNTSQLQYLQQQQIGKQWTWSAIRPSVVGGTAPGNPMNLALLIAVYATISKKLNIPLRFPGKIGAYHTLLEMTDATLLAKATVWAATEPQATNQAFNINNGDLFRWKDLWPKIAKYFNMEVDAPLPLNLQTMMSDKENIWEDIQKQQGLNYNYQEVSAWAFGDFVFSWDYDFFADGSKARRFGFHEYIDTEQMFFRLFDEMRNKQIIP
ncbi:SDR family oxidoreductase [Sphingobacterium sp. ML3W]|uniref:SDR family oxidoreductase n=1 Tax=Sphingobacterium sp. ML3W TaxID=1538644 RepID=UPI00249BA840|nr:SDR family oxidoreductase [Sphingobacterium sp. ML3W]WFA81572.1 SDR family oxidoreductase [Sphingobacterium sp. ML3W]